MTNTITLNSLYSQMNQSELYHHGILGMHWGIRRFQPYGQGYDPKNEGKETGLAARLAAQTDSYSKLYGRGSNMARAKQYAKQYAKQLGSRAKSGVNEALERLNYANDRLGENLKDAGKKAKAGLAKYAAGYDTDLDARRTYESASASDLARGVLSTFGSRAKIKVSDLKRTSWDDVRSAMGDGASRFQESMAKTKIASKQFSTNAQATMALLRGAMDPRSSASQIIEGRTPGGSKKYDRLSPGITPVDRASGSDYTKYLSGTLTPLNFNSLAKNIYDPGTNGGWKEYERDEVLTPDFIDAAHDPSKPELMISPGTLKRKLKRSGITLSELGSSSSTDIGKRLLGL